METNHKNGEKEKTGAALNSVFAAMLLTGMKIVVGIMTGSLGILAEAAHSGLDLIAAIVTLVAVRISGKPADEEHHFGHGKYENVSALFETLLLLITCVWIVYEAVHRLKSNEIKVDASIWAFGVMIISIIVDVSRSRMLFRAAEKFKSQALEADALHFSTDVWSSCAVIIGLTLVAVGNMAGKNGFSQFAFLEKADALAALGVAMIVIYVSMQLGVRTIKALTDSAPDGMPDKINEIVASIPGVIDSHNVRVRDSGPNIFVDVHIHVDGDQTLEEAHALTEEIEKKVAEVFPEIDITVHPEPAPKDEEG